MKQAEKISYLQENYMSEWLKAKQEADTEVSKSHHMICVCGKLCTGMHERMCSRFKKKVIRVALQKVKHLIPSKAKL